MSLELQLSERYIEIVKANQEFLDSTLEIKQLSKLFLTPVPDGYENAKNKIMVIGRETRHTLLKDNQDNSFKYDDVGVQTLIQENSSIYKKYLTNGKKKRGNGFFNFLIKIADKSGKDGIVWANIYAINYKGKHIKHLKNLEMIENIEKISKELLEAQIEILKPDIIIFATGNQGVETRRKYFPNETYTDKRDFEGIDVNDLWSFKLPNNSATCYRLHHPSARKKGKNQIEAMLFNQLPQKTLTNI